MLPSSCDVDLLSALKTRKMSIINFSFPRLFSGFDSRTPSCCPFDEGEECDSRSTNEFL